MGEVMLVVVNETARKKTAQRELESNLKSALKREGTHNIGFPGGNVDLPIYSAGPGKLWVAFGGITPDAAVRRFWNAFGVYFTDKSAQSIAVEINIPTDTNGGQVAGFFAEDKETGDIYLMHNGRVGGGRRGIGKSAFLVWSKAKLIEISDGHGSIRRGIAVGRLGDTDLADRIWAFVRTVRGFKDQAATGVLDTVEFKQRVKEFDRYSKEFSGTKRGARSGTFEYVTYHGDIVQKLFDERTDQKSPGEQVFNNRLIDLYVKKNGILSEVYEIKTGVGRQMLYTAIGQLVTHAANGDGGVTKFLVTPGGEKIPKDLQKAIEILGIKIRRFRIQRAGRNRLVELD